MGEDGRHGQLQRVANVQWTVLSVADIRQSGFTDRQIERLIRAGILHRRYKGVYTYGTNRPPWKGVLLAAQWSCGSAAYLTGRTALAIAKIRGLYLGLIEVAVPRRTIRARRAPLHLQRTSIPPERLRHDGPLRYATVPRALVDLAAAGASAKELRGLITEAIHLQKLDHTEMRELLQTHAGQPGITRLRAAYGSYLPRNSARSGLERSFDAGLETRPRIPGPVPNVYLRAAGIDWELDRYWPDQLVAVELQGGGYHDAREDREKDEFKAAKLAILGIQLLCVSETRWELEPEVCLDDLEAVLAVRGLRHAG